MNEQKRGSSSLMNLTLKNATVSLEMEPHDRKAVYRLTSHLLKFSVEDEYKRTLATALNYESAELMDDDINALARLIVQAQRAFGESKVPNIAFEPETGNKPIPAWLEQERDKWRRFELTSEDKSQVDELNNILTRHDLTRRELAVIVASLRVRPEFSLADFRT